MYPSDDETERAVKKGRTEAYIDAVKSKYKQLLCLGVLFLLALSPLVSYRYLTVAYEIEINAAESAKTLDALYKIRAYKNTFFLTAIPLSLLVALVAAGSAKVLKSIAWKEPTPAKDNFSVGVKENVLSYAICIVISVLLLWASTFVRYSSIGFLVWSYLPSVGWYLIVLPVGAWFCASTAVYKEGFFKTLGNSVKLYGRTLPQTLGVAALAVLPLLLMLIPVAWVQLVVPLLYSLCYLPFALLGFAFFANGVFDKYVNVGAFPDLVDRGLW